MSARTKNADWTKDASGDWVEETQIIVRAPLAELELESDVFSGSVARSSEPMESDVHLNEKLLTDEWSDRQPRDAAAVSFGAFQDDSPVDIEVASAELGSVGEELGLSATRVTEIWREWLGALATDSEAAMASAMAYRQFADDVRDEWISALESDLDGLPVSRVAVFAPLLAAETDPGRRLRIAQLIEPGVRDLTPAGSEEYLRGRHADGSTIALIVSPLYLDFVQVLACSYQPGHCFRWVRHDPITTRRSLLSVRDALAGVQLEVTPGNVVVDELAATVVAVHRQGQALPEALCLFAHLFSPAIQ